jgi:hypothetical protein
METHLADFKDECENQSSPFSHEQVGNDPYSMLCCNVADQSRCVIRMVDRLIAFSDDVLHLTA